MEHEDDDSMIKSIMASLYQNSGDDYNTKAGEQKKAELDATQSEPSREESEITQSEPTEVTQYSEDADNKYEYDSTNNDATILNDDAADNQESVTFDFDAMLSSIYKGSEDKSDSAAEADYTVEAEVHVNDEDNLAAEASKMLEEVLENEMKDELEFKQQSQEKDEEIRRVSFAFEINEQTERDDYVEYQDQYQEQTVEDTEQYQSIYVNADELVPEEIDEAIYEKIDDDDIYDEGYSNSQVQPVRQDFARNEEKLEIQTSDASVSLTAEEAIVDNHAGNQQAPQNADLQTVRKSQPQQSGKFLMRAVVKANPHHVIRCVTDNQAEQQQHDPEQDELVTYLKGETNGGEIRSSIQSMIASRLIQKFNQESENGTEVGQNFFPKFVQVSSGRFLRGSSSDTGVSQAEADSIRNDLVEKAALNGATESQSPEKLSVEIIDDPQLRNAEIAKAIEAAEFKPLKQPVRQVSSSKVNSKIETVETSPITRGISIYSRPNQVASDARTKDGSVLQDANKTPDWKIEIQKRKVANEYLVAQKPNEPIKLAEIPEWKRNLVEKNRARKTSSEENNNEPDYIINENQKEWKKEVREVLKQRERIIQEQQLPEWQQTTTSNK